MGAVVAAAGVVPADPDAVAVLAERARMSAPCWCCAMWGIDTPGTKRDQGMESAGWLCASCAASSPRACKNRHQRETVPASGQSSPVQVTESAAPAAPELRQGLKRSDRVERS